MNDKLRKPNTFINVKAITTEITSGQKTYEQGRAEMQAECLEVLQGIKFSMEQFCLTLDQLESIDVFYKQAKTKLKEIKLWVSIEMDM